MNYTEKTLHNFLVAFAMVSLLFFPLCLSAVLNWVTEPNLQNIAVNGLRIQIVFANMAVFTAALRTPFTWPGPHHYPNGLV